MKGLVWCPPVTVCWLHAAYRRCHGSAGTMNGAGYLLQLINARGNLFPTSLISNLPHPDDLDKL